MRTQSLRRMMQMLLPSDEAMMTWQVETSGRRDNTTMMWKGRWQETLSCWRWKDVLKSAMMMWERRTTPGAQQECTMMLKLGPKQDRGVTRMFRTAAQDQSRQGNRMQMRMMFSLSLAIRMQLTAPQELLNQGSYQQECTMMLKLGPKQDRGVTRMFRTAAQDQSRQGNRMQECTMMLKLGPKQDRGVTRMFRTAAQDQSRQGNRMQGTLGLLPRRLQLLTRTWLTAPQDFLRQILATKLCWILLKLVTDMVICLTLGASLSWYVSRALRTGCCRLESLLEPGTVPFELGTDYSKNWPHSSSTGIWRPRLCTVLRAWSNQGIWRSELCTVLRVWSNQGIWRSELCTVLRVWSNQGIWRSELCTVLRVWSNQGIWRLELCTVLRVWSNQGIWRSELCTVFRVWSNQGIWRSELCTVLRVWSNQGIWRPRLCTVLRAWSNRGIWRSELSTVLQVWSNRGIWRPELCTVFQVWSNQGIWRPELCTVFQVWSNQGIWRPELCSVLRVWSNQGIWRLELCTVFQDARQV
ncbi:uncharacterized protein [Heterodontus francisci]|uniref:uncharacterized protein isoform X1 n=1 Tax=Heterodontus francisci TaxID=7792 RepID=UPI00355C19BC